MDRFAKTMEDLKALKEDDRARFIYENQGLCSCIVCPTYTQCAKKGREGVYCLTGKSPNCIKQQKTCSCWRCPVHFKLGLTSSAFCLRGSEMELREKKK